MKSHERRNRLSKFIALCLSAAMLIGVFVPMAPAAVADSGTRIEKTENVHNSSTGSKRPVGGEAPDPNEIVRVSVVLEADSAFDAGYTADEAASGEADEYRAALYDEQKEMISLIEDRVLGGGELDVIWNLTLAANLISANVRRGDIARIEQLPGVTEVVEERLYTPDVVSTGGTYDPNMALAGDMNHTGSAWLAGYTGAGERIAIIDTGLAIGHLSFDPKAFAASIAEWEAETGKTASLLTAEDVADALEDLNIYKNGFVTVEDAAKLSPNGKVPFAFNYVDGDFEITHENDSAGEHGSHVAGIAAANRLVDENGDGEYEDAETTVGVVGNAPDAQLLIMKVFGKGGGAYDSDCVAAIEDALLLGADSVNLSLGGAFSGLGGPNAFYTDVMKKLETSDTVVVFSAGNTGAWASNTDTNGGDLYEDDVNFQTDGEPGSYSGAFTVGSVENKGLITSKITVGGNNYTYLEDTLYGNPHLSTLDTTGEGTEYDFYILPNGSAGKETQALEYIGSDVSGKIVFCWRGETSFVEKAEAAEAAGAIAVVIINNEAKDVIANLEGYEGTIPVVTLSEGAGGAIYDYCKSLDGQVEGKYHGKVTIVKKPYVPTYTDDGKYEMSDFSSWGVPGDLTLKPEISAPGGNIYSVNGLSPDGTSYETMSGTSMAAPQISGMIALIQQYLRDAGYDTDGMTLRALTQSLLMSTAEPMKAANGSYYSVMQQGAGLANVGAAVSTPVFITVGGRTDGKAKAELGEDALYNGEYTIEFTLHNLTGMTHYYDLSADVFTQAVANGSLKTYTTAIEGVTVTFYIDGKEVKDSDDLLKYDFNGDGDFNRRDAQLLLDHVIKGTAIENHANETDVDGDGDVDTHDVHVLLTLDRTCAEVPANGEVSVKAVITLSDEAKASLKETYKNGAYIEAFVKADPLASDDGAVPPELSFPVLGFFGNWSAASMYDSGDYITNNIMKNGTKTPYLADVNIVNGTSFYNYMTYSLSFENYEYENEFFGSPVNWDGTVANRNNPLRSWYYEERNSISDNMRLEAFYVAITRTAGNGVVQVKDANSGEVYYREEVGTQYSAFYNGAWTNTLTRIPIGWSPADCEETLADGTVLEVSLILAPEYYADENGKYNWDVLTDGKAENGELGDGAYFSYTMTVDNTPPEIEYLEAFADWDILFLMGAIYDNRYIAGIVTRPNDDPDEYVLDAIQPNFLYYGENGDPYDEGMMLEFEAESYGYDPNMDYDNWDYWPDISGVYYVEVWDYAANITTYRLYVDCDPTYDVERVEIYVPEYYYDENGYEQMRHKTVSEIDFVEGASTTVKAVAYPTTLESRDVIWSSDDPGIAKVENGTITGVSVGETTIRATSTLDPNVSAECKVKVERVDVTASGVLIDSEGITRLYDWNVPERHITMGSSLSGQVVAGTKRHDSDNFYLLDTRFDLYEYTPEGEVVGGPWRWRAGSNGMAWDIVDTSLGMFAAYGTYILGPMEHDQFAPVGYNIGAASPYGDANFIGITAVEGEWSSSNPETGETIGGNVLLYAFDSYGYVWTIYPFQTDEGLMIGIDYVRSDIPAIWTLYADGNPYTSLTMGEDGNLYISIYTGENSVLYQLRYDAENNTYRGMPLDQTDYNVWPAILLDVKPNNAASGASLDAAAAVETVVAPESVEVIKSADKRADGGLHSVSNAGSADSDPGIAVDAEAGTVTVPVYAKDTTNGEFTLRYDTDKLTLKETITGGMLTSVVTDTEKGEILVGYADKENIDAAVLTAVFTYTPKVNRDDETAIVIDVAEDGELNVDTGDALGATTTDVTLTGVTVEHTLTVKYVDENGNEIKEPTETVLLEGADYTVDAPAIDGYKYKGADGELSGTLNADLTVTLTYRTLAVYTLTVKYVDEDGKSIKDPTETKVREDKDYEVTPPAIDGYEYKSADAELKGKLSADKTVTLTYKKNAVVTPGESGNPNVPQTGDSMTGRAALLAAAILSGIAVASLGFIDTKKKH